MHHASASHRLSKGKLSPITFEKQPSIRAITPDSPPLTRISNKRQLLRILLGCIY